MELFSDMDYPIAMYPGINVFVREDGETPEDQILGVKSDDKLHSLERYIQGLGLSCMFSRNSSHGTYRAHF